MTSSGVNLHSGDVFQVHLSYNGTNLAMTITDVSTASTFSQTFQNINIPGTVGGNTAYVGFTGGTGGETAIQEIIDWSYVSGPAPPQISPAPGSYTNAVTARRHRDDCCDPEARPSNPISLTINGKNVCFLLCHLIFFFFLQKKIKVYFLI